MKCFALVAVLVVFVCAVRGRVHPGKIYRHFDDYLLSLEVSEPASKYEEAQPEGMQSDQWPSVRQYRPPMFIATDSDDTSSTEEHREDTVESHHSSTEEDDEVKNPDQDSSFPTDDEDLMNEGSGWNEEKTDDDSTDNSEYSLSSSTTTTTTTGRTTTVARSTATTDDDDSDDDQGTIFGIKLPKWFHIRPMNNHRQETTTTTTSASTTPPSTTAATTTTESTTTTTTTTAPEPHEQHQSSAGRFNKEQSSPSVDILDYFRDVPREHWSCCMLGLLAGDKGFHCQAQFYAARVTMRNRNRAHNKKLGFAGRHSSPDWGHTAMRSFQRCVAHKADEFHKCCYAATVEKREMSKWQEYRNQRVSVSNNNTTDTSRELPRPDPWYTHTDDVIQREPITTRREHDEPMGRQSEADVRQRRMMHHNNNHKENRNIQRARPVTQEELEQLSRDNDDEMTRRQQRRTATSRTSRRGVYGKNQVMDRMKQRRNTEREWVHHSRG